MEQLGFLITETLMFHILNHNVWCQYIYALGGDGADSSNYTADMHNLYNSPSLSKCVEVSCADSIPLGHSNSGSQISLFVDNCSAPLYPTPSPTKTLSPTRTLTVSPTETETATETETKQLPKQKLKQLPKQKLKQPPKQKLKR